MEEIQEAKGLYLIERLPQEMGRDYALRMLKDNIVCPKPEPGSLVSENGLTAEMGLSHTPVREALIELSKVRIVEIYPRRESTTARIDCHIMEEAKFMCRVLECAVVELDCALAGVKTINMLQENVRLQQPYLENYYTEILTDLDNQFHRLLFKIAQKPRVYTLTNTISIHFDRVRSIALTTVKSTEVAQDHQALTTAMAQKDTARTRVLMEAHLDRHQVGVEKIQVQHPSYFI